jgi:hypothetical protein
LTPQGKFSLDSGMGFAFYCAMGTKKQRSRAVASDPGHQAWRSPIQEQLDGLFEELAAFNERIAELAKQGHRSHAISVLKAQALSLAGQIDEFRCLLVVPKR